MYQYADINSRSENPTTMKVKGKIINNNEVRILKQIWTNFFCQTLICLAHCVLEAKKSRHFSHNKVK